MRQSVFTIANKIRLMMTIKKSLPGAFKWSPRTNPECWGRWGETDGIFNHCWTCTSLQECSVSFLFRSLIDKLSWKKSHRGFSRHLGVFWEEQVVKADKEGEFLPLVCFSSLFSYVIQSTSVHLYRQKHKILLVERRKADA